MAEPPPGEEVDDLVADLFGDFSESEGSQPGRAASGKGSEKGSAQAQRPGGQATGEESPSSSTRRSAEGEPEAGSRPKKRRKAGDDPSRFFDTEAVEGGGDSGDEDGDLEDLIDDDAADIPQDQNRQRAELDAARAEMDRRDAEGSTVRRSGYLDLMEEKYTRQKDDKDEGIAVKDIGRSLPSAQARQADTSKKNQTTFIVPDTARDPRLWCCKTFAPERELCLSLLLKAGISLSADKPCPIYSAFYNPALRGYVYVEAHKENDIRAFTKGIRGISPWAIRLVPVAQMAQVFSSAVYDASTKETIKMNEWVRLKRGPYAGDLALIDEIQDNEYTVRLKPRLDYSGVAGKKSASIGVGETRETRKADKNASKRPAARWFNRADIEAAGLVISSERERRFTSKGFLSFFMVDDEVYRDGFLYKKFKSHFFITGEMVRPSEHEMQDWRAAPPPSPMTTPEVDLPIKQPGEEERDRKMMPPPSLIPIKSGASLQQKVGLIEEDIVIVTHGDLTNMRGVVTKAFPGGPTVTVRPYESEGLAQEALTVAVDRLSKYFEIGDHIKAVGGSSMGMSGYVVQVHLLPAPQAQWGFGASITAVTMNGTTATEFKLLVNHARLSVEKAASEERLGEFFVGDIVSFENNVAVLVRLEAGQRAILLDVNRQTQVATLGSMQKLSGTQKGSGKAKGLMKQWTNDRSGNRITTGSNVQAYMRTVPRGIKAEVLYIFGKYCFLKASEMLVGEKAYMVLPGSACEFIWSNKPDPEQAVKDIIEEKEKEKLSKGLQELHNPFNTTIQKASETDFLKSWFKKMMGMSLNPAAEWSKGDAVRITGGTYKGLRGEVRDVLGETVRLSLLAKPKLVVVPLVNVAKDDYTARGEKAWLLERQDSEVRRDNAGEDYNVVPGTPVPDDAPIVIPPSPVSDSDNDAILAIAAGPTAKDKDKMMAQDRKEWNPEFGLEADAADAPATPAAPGLRLSRHPSAASPRNAAGTPTGSQGARTPVAASALTPAATTPLGGGDEDMPQVQPDADAVSQSGGSSRVDDKVKDEDATWMMLGLGVSYKEGDGEQPGWIYKVNENSVLVVPSRSHPEAGCVPLEEMKELKESQIRPATIFVKGDSVAFIKGAKRNNRGKVISKCGASAVNLQVLKPPAGIVTRGQRIIDLTLVAQKKELALFSPGWERAALDGTVPDERTALSAPPTPDIPVRPRMDAPPSPRSQPPASPRSQPPASPRSPVLVDGAGTPDVDMYREPADGGLRTAMPGFNPAMRASLAGTPQTVQDETPQAMMDVDTPSTLKNETPLSDPGSSVGGETPFGQRATARGRSSRLPGAAPSPRSDAGGVTPTIGFTPQTSGGLTPMQGGVTPRLPGVNTPTPVPFGASTPMMMQYGGDTPTPQQPGGVSPMGAAAVPGVLTPQPGITTPNDKKFGEVTPGMTRGGVTPASSSGQVTPESKYDDKNNAD